MASAPRANVSTVFDKGEVIYQLGDDDGSELPEAALLIHNDASGLVLLEQDGRQIVINHATIPTLAKRLLARRSE